jgi:hypothetical protein
MPSPEIRFGLTRFAGLEALRSQRWPIALLIVARAVLLLAIAAVLLLGAFSPEQLPTLHTLILLK